MPFLSNINFDNLIPYCIFPNSFIRNGKIPPQEKVLFEILCSYDHLSKDGNRKGWCEVGLDTVAEQMGLEKRMVQIHLNRLIEKGFVTVVYRNTNPRYTGDPRSSIYILNILPGLSEADIKRIVSTMTVTIKHKISGLNTIRVKTSRGVEYIPSAEEFDLEYLITGNRSSEVLDDIADEETPKTEKEEDIFTFKANDKPSQAKSNPEPNINDPDPIVRILMGNYNTVDVKDICKYFSYVYRQAYPIDPEYLIDRTKDSAQVKLMLGKVKVDTFIPMMEFFVRNYDRMFANSNYPRPKIFQMGITWIWNKLSDEFVKYQSAAKKTNEAESIQVQINNFETLDI
jgi:hypothetical protein